MNYDLLKDNDRYKSIIKKFKEQFLKEKLEAKSSFIIRVPEDYSPDKSYPLLIALHWGNSSPEDFEHYWIKAVNNGYILVLPQSSQLSGFRSYTWTDLDKGLSDLKETYNKVIQKYNINREEILLAGASIGGTLAIETTFFKPLFPIKGLITVIPFGIDTEKIKNITDKTRARIFLITGTEDESYESCKKMNAIFKKNEIDSKLYKSVGTGHIFPDNFEEILKEILKEISKI